MRTWMLVFLAGCATPCDGGSEYFYSARLVVGVEPQTIRADELPADATTLVIRGANEAVYPLVPASPEVATRISVTSEFQLAVVQQSNTSLEGTARIGEMGVIVPLRTLETLADPEYGLYTRSIDDPPITDTWRGSFEVELRRAETSVRVKVDVAPFFNPCGDDFSGPTPSEYPPEARIEMALNSTATCLDGTVCIARGTVLDRDVRSLVIAPFVISTRVQAWCDFAYGY